jgi:mono/diheme cytochrome c family protein
MTGRILRGALLGLMLAADVAVQGQSPAPASTANTRPDYDVAYIGQPLPDPVMQHNKETFVSFGCAYCHGLTLIPRGEAADLMHSALVGADADGSMIVPLLKSGIPQTAKLSPMPQFSDLSDQQLHAIARYIHYARQQGRYQEIVASPAPAGEAAAGKAYFDQQCATCHAADLNGIASRHDPSELRDQMLRPKSLVGASTFTITVMTDAKTAAARQRHNALLENYTPAQVANLLAYLKTR